MKKPVAVFDIDGTIFRSSLYIEITNALISAHIFPPSATEIYRSAYEEWLNRDGSYEAYLEKMVETFNSNLKGTRTIAMEVMAEVVINALSRRTYRYTRDLVKQLKQTHFLVAISGSPTELVSRFCQIYGFDDFKASKYDTKDGVYNGKSQLGTTDKDKAVKAMVKKHRLTFTGSIGVGDSESDIPFLSLMERPIAFNPNSRLFKVAIEKNWQVVVERKDVVYYYNKR